MTTESRTTTQPAAEPASRAAVARACACLSRRHALTSAAVVGVGVPFLAACGADDSSTATDSPSAPASSAAGSSAPSDPATSAGGEAPSGLTTTADIPVGGGKIFADEEVVITQPTAGEFKAFTNICTHQGCAVSSVEDGVIVCNCHNSSFSIEDGSVEGGPASSPLEEIALTVDGDSISLA